MTSEPKREIRFGARLIRRQPPVVGHWCDPPTTRKATNPVCVYLNAGCGAGSSVCPFCHFPFCDTHLPLHRRRFECPVDVWKAFNARRKAWYTRVEKHPETRPTVNVEFPDADPEDADG